MSSINKSISSGITYTAISKYSSVFISILIAAILARLLTPEEFGIIALVTVFVSFFNLLSDFGLGQAVIQNQTLQTDDIESIFTFSVLLALLLSGLFFLAAPLISKFYDKHELINIARLLSLSIFFHSIQMIPSALLRKALKFKKIGIIVVSTQLVSGFIAIILAYAGFSYYALVIKSLIDGIITFVVFYWLSPVRIIFKIKWSSINKIIGFSSFMFFFNFINYFSRNADNILIGKHLGPAALGYYDKSYRLMMMPIQNLTRVITPVLMPVLSQYTHEYDVIYKTYIRIVKILATIGFPLSIFLYFSAPEIINIIYGSQWNNSIPVFKLLAFTVGIQMIYSSAPSIFQAINRTDLLFYFGIIGSVFMLGAISYGVFISKSLEGVALGLIFAFTINFFIMFFMLIKLALGKPLFHFLNTIVFPLVISIGIAFTLWLYSEVESENIFYSFATKLTISVFTFGIIFLSLRKNRKLLQQTIKSF